MATPPHVIDVDEAQFEALMQQSLERPIVLDFWAEWCGPCKTLGPMLEQIAADYDGAFVLAKVDVDRNPRLAQAFGAQSIPSVFAVFQGQMVDRFTGALPRAQLDSWFAGLFQTLQIDARPRSGQDVPNDPAAAERHWRDQLAQDPEHNGAKLELGRILFTTGEIAEAEELLGAVPAAAKEYGPAQAALALKELFVELEDAGGADAARVRYAEGPDDPDNAYHYALAEGVGGRFASALELLVDQVERGAPEVRERAKGRAQILLGAAGRGDDDVEAQRRRLGRLLF